MFSAPSYPLLCECALFGLRSSKNKYLKFYSTKQIIFLIEVRMCLNGSELTSFCLILIINNFCSVMGMGQ